MSSDNRLNKLVKIMQEQILTKPENLKKLKLELYKFTNDEKFKKSKSMGDIIKASFDFVKNHYLNVDLYNLFQ